MDQRHKQLLKKHRRQLLDINTTDVVVDYLFEEQIISGDEKDVICQKPTPEERSRALLDILPRKGAQAFDALLQALRRGVTKRHRELADLLDPPAPATSGRSSKKATSTASGSKLVKPARAKPTAAKPTTAAKKPAAESHPDLLEPPAPASSGSSSSSGSSKKATSTSEATGTSGTELVKPATAKPTVDTKKPVAESHPSKPVSSGTSGSELVKPATAKPTVDAKKPVQVAESHPSKPVFSGDSSSRRHSTHSVKNPDLGTCPKCSDGNLRLRKGVGGTPCKIGCSNFDGGCKGFITFPDFVTDVSPAGRNCKCGKKKVELKFMRGKAPEGMKQGYKGCINGDCDPVMKRNGWTITKTGGGGGGSGGKPMGGAMSLTGNCGDATSPGSQPAATSSGTIDASIPSWLCNCRKPAIRLQVKKEGRNHGRWFHKCATGKCKFWKWEDEHLHDRHTSSSSQQMHATSRSSSQSLSSGSVNASGRGLKRPREEMNGGGDDGDSTPKRKLRTCSVCKNPGHTKPNCPSTSSAQ